MKDKFQPLQPRELRYVDIEVKEKSDMSHDELMAEISRLRGELEKFNRTGSDFKDAERYRFIRANTFAELGGFGRQEFIIPEINRLPSANLMRGSVAQHFDDAVDAMMGNKS